MEIVFCGYNLFCHIRNIEFRPKYPPDVAVLCQYFEEQKSQLPDYCKWKSEVKPPRNRNEF
ncbi:hypothetical protein [Synechococcus phage DSL-LC02]|nr:hypothetical protein [Synechococcus phage DSL-LC02]